MEAQEPSIESPSPSLRSFIWSSKPNVMNVGKEGPEETEILVPLLCTKPESVSMCVYVFASQATAYYGAEFIGKKPYLRRWDAESGPKTSQ